MKGGCMFNIGLPELLIIAAIALIVFGPNKLPELAKGLGKAMREFKKATEEVKESFEAETKDLKELKDTLTQENPLTDLAEEMTTSMEVSKEPSSNVESSGVSTVSEEKSLSGETLIPEGTSTSIEEKKAEEGKKEESKLVKEGTSPNG
jgi:TatA/E family protein of Tat protein translocase